MASRIRRGLLAGAIGIIALTAAVPRIGADYGRDRTISLFNIHTKETLTVQYKKGGKHVPEALEKINWAMRDWRRDEATRMDPALIDLIWEIHAELGSKEPVHIISGYRSRSTNEMLRANVGGQASESRHILGKAADVHFPDVPLKLLRYSALIRERGGVGYYPTSAIPFVHVDTDRVRHWPRLPKYELALLFPQGRTQHIAADGRQITKEDVRVAQGRFRDLAVQVAEYHALRKQPKSAATLLAEAAGRAQKKPVSTQVAALSAAPLPSEPQLASAPTLVERPSRFTMRPTEGERAKLASLVALAAMPQLIAPPRLANRRKPASAAPAGIGNEAMPTTGLSGNPADVPPAPQLAAIDPGLRAAAQGNMMDTSRSGWGTGWASAPAFDEEHPEELSYRPFPLAPLLTTSASYDDPVLTRLVHHDVARTLDLMDQTGSAPPMKLRPGQQAAQLMWAQQFKGEPLDVGMRGEPAGSAAAGIPSRKVRTSDR